MSHNRELRFFFFFEALVCSSKEYVLATTLNIPWASQVTH